MTSSPSSRWHSGRLGVAVELAACAALITLMSLYALWRMDYLSADTAHHIRLTDNSRSAYVAKNIADGNGYTTNDLPASLIDFYHERGKLHAEHWVNADRFPFTAYAIAALYKVTGSTSEQTGILLYNLICFVGFLTLLYWLAHQVFRERYTGLIAIAIALLHPYTYIYLYLKDADMLLLTAGCLACLYRYFLKPPGTMSRRLAILLGTLLAWLFLARPNLGAPFILFFGIVMLRRAWTGRGDGGLGASVRRVVTREGIVALACALWCMPFVIHSMREWGSPLFSANNLYQLPLGTRFGMGTDTWWKYTDPSTTLSFGMVADGAGDQLWSKMTSSWIATIKLVVRSFAIELFLAFGFFAWLSRRAEKTAEPASDTAVDHDRMRAFRAIAGAVAFAVLLNFAVLPLYGYQGYAYRHYLGFALPIVWLAAGRAVYLLALAARPQLTRIADHFRAHRGLWVLVLILAVVAWNFGSKSIDGNALFVRTSKFVGKHWLTSGIILLAILGHRHVLRRPIVPRLVALIVVLVFARYQPNTEIKRLSLNFFPANERVWDVLRERKGLVASFALQGEVAWTSGRKNIPAPELPMHIYSFLYDHQLEVEDVYIESAATMLNPLDGPFSRAAPGFEGYVRLQKFQAPLPGYEIVFHDATSRAYPKYNVKPRAKASTVYRLTDRAAVRDMARSPDKIDLADSRNAIYLAHGFGDYVMFDGRPVVVANDATRTRYKDTRDAPFEDAGITFFLDDRRPTAVELEIYAPYETTYEFYWNLDLFAYDRATDRPAHRIGVFAVPAPGWHRVRLPVPPGVTRKGLNKLGFRPTSTQNFVQCPPELSDDACLELRPYADPELRDNARPIRLGGADAVVNVRITLLATMLWLHY